VTSPKSLSKHQIERLLARMIDAVPDKIDDAKLGDVIRALVMLRQTLSEDDGEVEVDADGARARLEHLIARIADAQPAPRDP
jgi:hypothetical protein